jgi:plastin-1
MVSSFTLIYYLNDSLTHTSKLINVAVPHTIDTRVINIKVPLNPWQKNENLVLAINSAKGIGCSTVNVVQASLMEGRIHIVLGLVWQIIKIGLLQDINLKQHPELVRLLEEGEELSDLLKLPADQLLIRWVNYHMKEAGSSRRIKNFSGDIKDSEVYTLLLKRIAPNKECDDSPLSEQDLEVRADKMLDQADKIGCRKFVRPADVTKGNPKLNLAFVANLFNNHPALESIDLNDYADLLDFDSEGTREERAFRFWIQSLGEDITNLFEDLKDGTILLRLFDKVQPKLVDWKKVAEKPKNKYQALENTNYVVNLAKQLKFSTVNIGGSDIYAGNKKLILGLVWQLMRQSLLNTIKDIGNGKDVNESDILKWANEKVPSERIESFKDPALKTGSFLVRLCHAVAPRSVNLDLLTPGTTDEEAEQNAKYAISVARKIGATVFLLWEDIVEVKPKMILAFIASIMKVALKPAEQN